MRTEVAIVGGGPAGLLLAHLLHQAGVATVVLEQRSREAVEHTIRAGVLEQGTVDLLGATGLGERLSRDGVVHHGIELRFGGRGHRIPLSELTGGRAITLYPQHEVLRDLISARLVAGGPLLFGARVTHLDNSPGRLPRLRYEQQGIETTLNCDFVVGCDGFHSIVRSAIPQRREFQTTYPFAWYGILQEGPPLAPELIYTHHARGFALASTRTPSLQRLYLQCPPDTQSEDWSDAHIRHELGLRLATADGAPITCCGKIIQKDVVAMRSFVCETMRHGRLLLAGDAAHIVPPTGAKGMNLALNDIRLLAPALVSAVRHGDDQLLQQYPADSLVRIWRAQRFSGWMTRLLHQMEDADPYQQRLQQTELERLVSSRAAALALAEEYVG